MGGPGSGKPAGYGGNKGKTVFGGEKVPKGYSVEKDVFGDEILRTKVKAGGTVSIKKLGKNFYRINTGTHYQDHNSLDNAVSSVNRNFK